MGLMDLITQLMGGNQGKTPPGATPPYMPTNHGGQQPPQNAMSQVPMQPPMAPGNPMPPGNPIPQPSAPGTPPQQMGPPKSLLGDLGAGPDRLQGPPRDQLQENGVEGMLANQIGVPDREKAPAWIDQPWYKDKDRMSMLLAAASNGFGNMTLRGNSGLRDTNAMLMKAGQSGIEDNKTMKYLAKNNPELFKVMTKVPPNQRGQYMKLAMEKRFGVNNNFRTNTSGVQTDEKTGRQYVLTSDGHGNSKVKFLTDEQGNPLTGETGVSKNENQIYINGVNAAMDKGAKFFDQGEAIRADIRIMNEARTELADGAQTGVWRQYLPSLDENTARLRSLANSAGINIINSATFGALSEKELELALSTGIPINLSEEELDGYLAAKIQAQEKLYGEVNKKARDLNSGTQTLGQWQDAWAAEDEGMQYDDAYAQPYSNLEYRPHDKSASSGTSVPEDPEIIDVTEDDEDDTVSTGPRRRRI